MKSLLRTPAKNHVVLWARSLGWLERSADNREAMSSNLIGPTNNFFYSFLESGARAADGRKVHKKRHRLSLLKKEMVWKFNHLYHLSAIF